MSAAADRQRDRAFWGFLAGPLFGAVVLTVLAGLQDTSEVWNSASAEVFLLIATICGYVFALVSSLPVCLILRGRIRWRLVVVVLAGALTADLPLLLLDLASHGDLEVRFVWDVLAAGGAAGFVFWLIAVRGDRHAERRLDPPRDQPADAFD